MTDVSSDTPYSEQEWTQMRFKVTAAEKVKAIRRQFETSRLVDELDLEWLLNLAERLLAD